MTRADRRPGDACLQCGESRQTVKAEGLFCAIVEGYEQPEVTDEWEHHRWRPWTDAELERSGIAPAAYDKHRWTPAKELAWVRCDDTVGGHAVATEGDLEWTGCRPGQCVLCGTCPTPITAEETA